MNYPREVGHAAPGQHRNVRRALISLLKMEMVWPNHACRKTDSSKPDRSVAPLSDPLHQAPWGDRAIASRSAPPRRASSVWHQGTTIWNHSPTPPPDPITEGNSAGVFPRRPFLYATPISFFAGPPHRSLLGTTRAGLLSPQDEKAQRRGNLYCRAYIISPVNACVWPGFLGLLDRAVDAVQSSLLSVPNKMAIKAQVRGHSPQAISTPKWLIIIMCGLNQEPVMSRVH